MKSIIKNNLMLFVKDKKKLFVFMVFSFFCGTSIGTALDANMSVWEFALFLMTNHYYIIYFLFMTYIFFSMENMREESDLMYVRMGTIKRQYICRIITSFLQALLYVGVHVVLVLVIGAPIFSWANEFGATNPTDYYNEVLVFMLAFKNEFSSPVEALAVTSFYLSLGMGAISMIIYCVQKFFTPKITTIVVGILILDVMLGFKLAPNDICEILFLNNYFILHHVLFSNGVLYTLLNVAIAIGWIWLGYWCLKRKNGNRIAHQKNWLDSQNSKYIGYSAVFLVAYIILNFVSQILTENSVTSTDLAFSVLLGYSPKAFALSEFVRYVLFFMLPIFFVGTIWERERNSCNQLVEIRYGSRKRWRKQLTKSIGKIVLKYVAVFTVLMAIGTAVLVVSYENGISNFQREFAEFAGITEKQLQLLLPIALILKCVELFYYKKIFEVIYGLCRNTVVAYLLTFSGFVLGFILPDSWLVSYGCSSIYVLSGEVATMGLVKAVARATTVLSVKIIILRWIEHTRKESVYE